MTVSSSRRLHELTEEVDRCERACRQERSKLDRLFGDAMRVDRERCQFSATQLGNDHIDAVAECLRVNDQVLQQLNIYLISLEQLRKACDTLAACQRVAGVTSQSRRERSAEDVVSPLWT